VLGFTVAGSMKDALRKAGLGAPDPAPRRRSKEFREPLSDDESLPPLFDAPAMTVPIIQSPDPTPLPKKPK
jgi:hypothetical protein